MLFATPPVHSSTFPLILYFPSVISFFQQIRPIKNKMSSKTTTRNALETKSSVGMGFQPLRNISETSSQYSTTKSSKVLVQKLAVLGKKVYESVAALSLSTHDDVSDSTKALWLGSTTNIPQILEGSECWSITPPTISEIIISTLDLIEKRSPIQASHSPHTGRGGLTIPSILG